MKYIEYITYIVTAASIAGTIANSFKKWWCFVIWACTNSFWFTYNTIHGHRAQALLYLFNFIMAIVGIWQWKKKGKR